MSAVPIMILGAGPAGMAAAEAASSSGEPVLVIDENQAPGGQIWRGGAGHWSDKRAARLWQQLQDRPHVDMMFGTRLVSTAGPRMLLAETPGGSSVLPWRRIVICSGARELLLPFPGWTLPGVTGAGGLQALIKGGMPIAGKRVVVAGTGPLLLAAADAVRQRGGIVVAIVEQQDAAALARFAGALALAHLSKFIQATALFARLRSTPYLRAATISAAHGEQRVRSVVIEHAGVRKELACDFLAFGFGLLPSLESAALFGCATIQGKVTVDAAQHTSVEGVWAAGESTGIGGVDKALAEGRIAGFAAAGQVASSSDRRALTKATAFAQLLNQTFPPPQAMRSVCQADTIVCRCEDVRAGALAVHADWRSAKLQTRAGMGPCQGRVCGPACQFLYGWEAPDCRPPVFPVSAAALASIGTDGD